MQIIHSPNKIIIDEQDYEKKIFKPIVDKIYSSRIKKAAEMYSSPESHYVIGPDEINKIQRKEFVTDSIGSVVNNMIINNISNVNTVPGFIL